MPRKSKYNVTKTEHSFCSKCKKRVVLLSSDNLRRPMFYICWRCEWIGQVGVGPVTEDRRRGI